MGVAARGIPQRLLSNNGDALNPIRRGAISELVASANSLGVATITGKPYRPTTQGKNERLHSTLFKWLKKHPFAKNLAELQRQVEVFYQAYNTQRGHQSLDDRMTPQKAWDATPVAEPLAPGEWAKRSTKPAPSIGEAVLAVPPGEDWPYRRVKSNRQRQRTVQPRSRPSSVPSCGPNTWRRQAVS